MSYALVYALFALVACGDGHRPTGPGDRLGTTEAQIVFDRSDVCCGEREQIDAFEIYVMNSDGTAPTRITNRPGFDGYAVASPDGARIAFISYGQGSGNGIHVMNADGTGVRFVTAGVRFVSAGIGRPAWSPDGAKIAFAVSWSEMMYPRADIYVVNADGTGLTALTHAGMNLSPSWSPDGTRIAFGYWLDARENGVPDEGGIDVMDVDGSNHVRLLSGGYDPAWSPDGRRIALLYPEPVWGRGQIWIMNADGSGLTRLTSSQWDDREPAWSPDGTHIAFTRTDGSSDIFVIDAGGSSLRNLTNTSAINEGSASWRRSR